jgi:hypothetical protein
LVVRGKPQLQLDGIAHPNDPRGSRFTAAANTISSSEESL